MRSQKDGKLPEHNSETTVRPYAQLHARQLRIHRQNCGAQPTYVQEILELLEHAHPLREIRGRDPVELMQRPWGQWIYKHIFPIGIKCIYLASPLHEVKD